MSYIATEWQEEVTWQPINLLPFWVTRGDTLEPLKMHRSGTAWVWFSVSVSIVALKWAVCVHGAAPRVPPACSLQNINKELSLEHMNF